MLANGWLRLVPASAMTRYRDPQLICEREAIMTKPVIFVKSLRARLIAIAIVVAAVFAVTLSTPASAASGCSLNLCVATKDSEDPTYQATLTLTPRLDGRYHVHLWKSTHPDQDMNTEPVDLLGGNTYRNVAQFRGTRLGSLHKHETLCAELWRDLGGGRYDSWGRPCITH